MGKLGQVLPAEVALQQAAVALGAVVISVAALAALEMPAAVECSGMAELEATVAVSEAFAAVSRSVMM